MPDNVEIPQISIILPVYNVEQYIIKCLKSILKQSFKDFELIIVDDGSTDQSIENISGLIDRDQRCVILHKKNGGLSDARNYGLHRARGEYIVFVDSDDYLEKDYLFELYNLIKSSDSEVAMCLFKYVDEDGNSIVNEVYNFHDGIKAISGKTLLEYSLLPGGVANIVMWNKIYRRKLFENINFTKDRYYEDDLIGMPLFWDVGKVSISYSILYNYVQRSGGIMHSEISSKKIADAEYYRQFRMSYCMNKDKKLFFLTVMEYKNWIFGLTKNWNLINSNDQRRLQNKYRELVRTCKSQTAKGILKDILGYFSLTICSLFRKSIKNN